MTTDPYTDTTHSPETEAKQDTLSQILAEHHAKSAGHFEAHLARLDALADVVVAGVDDPIACGIGAMGIKAETGQPIQYPDATQEWTGTFRELAAWVSREARIGRKFDPPCVYPAVPKVPQSCKAANYHHSRIVAVDIDHIHSGEQYERVLETCAQWACIPFSTSSHNPPFVWRLRIYVLLSHAARSVEEHRRVSARLCSHLSELTGVQIDVPVTTKAFQPALLPAWKDQAAKSMALLPSLVEAPAYPSGEMLEEIRAEIRAEEEAEAEDQRVRERVQLDQVIVDGAVDRVAGARHDLKQFPIQVGAGERNKRIPRAVGICREWGLDAAAAERLMLEVYGDDVDEGGWISRWVSTVYSKTDTEGRDGRRLIKARTRATWDGLSGVSELDFAPGPHATNYVEKGGHVDQTGGPQAPVDSTPAPAAGPHDAHAANLPPVLRTVGGIPAVLVHMPKLPVQVSIEEQGTRLRLVRSPCGSGKTYAIRLAIHRALQEGKRVVVVVPRRSLARALAAALGLPCYLDQVGQITGSTVVCLDSVHRVDTWTVERDELVTLRVDFLVLDEVQQLCRHAFGGTLRKRRAIDRCWRAMRDLCRASDRIRASDAGLDLLAISMLRTWVGVDATAELMINTHTGPRVDTFVRRSETAWMREVSKEINKARKVWIYSTSKRACKAISKRLSQQFPNLRMLVIHSEKTAGEARACLRDPNQFGCYDIVCCTGSVGTGVSVEHQDTWSVFGHLTATRPGKGPIAPDVYQGLSRVRHPLENRWHLVLLGRAPRVSDDAHDHYVDHTRLAKDTRARLDGLTAFDVRYGVDGKPELVPENDQLLQSYCEVLAYEGRYSGDYHDSVLEDGTRIAGSIRRLWEEFDLGLVVDLDVLDEQNALARTHDQEAEEKAAAKDLAAARVEVDEEDDAQTAAALEVTREEAKRLEAEEDRTPESVAQIKNERLRSRYGLDHLTPEDVAWDRKHWSGAVHFAHVALWQEGERQGLLAGDAKAGGCSLHWRHTHQEAELLAALWKKCGIINFEQDTQAGTTIRSPGPLLQSRAIRDGLRRVLKMEFKTEDCADGMILVRSLAKKCGIKLKSTRPRGAAGRQRIYTLDLESVQELMSKTAAYRQRLKDPEGAKAKQGPVIHMGPTAAEVQDLVAAIMAA